ncbi:hypothetical protein V8E53_009854 [Lactarius tabidus]
MQEQSDLGTLARTQSPADIEAQVLSPPPDVREPSAVAQALSPDFIQLIRRALEPVFRALPVPQNVAPYDDHVSSLQRPVPGNDTPNADHASSLPIPVPQASPSATSLILPNSMSHPEGPSTDVGGSGNSHV